MANRLRRIMVIWKLVQTRSEINQLFETHHFFIKRARIGDAPANAAWTTYIRGMQLSWWTASFAIEHPVSGASSLSLKRRTFLIAQYFTACYVIKRFLRLTGTQCGCHFYFQISPVRLDPIDDITKECDSL